MTGHAGLEEGQFHILAFKETQLLQIFKELDITIDGDHGPLMKDGKPLKCSSCNSSLTKKNVSAILPGSKLLICDDLSCISEYITEHYKTVCSDDI